MDKESKSLFFIAMIVGIICFGVYLYVNYEATNSQLRNTTIKEYVYRDTFVLQQSQQCLQTKSRMAYDSKVMGTSMLPTIPPYSTLNVIPYNERIELVNGDIVLLDSGDESVVHRITAIYPTYFLTKGDNNAREDNTQWNTSQIRYVVCGVNW